MALKYIKALFEGKNKQERLRWCLSMLDQRTLQTELMLLTWKTSFI
jgi:hypothetical protein